jgi:hypothetical protein
MWTSVVLLYFLGTPSVHSVHYYYPFALEDGAAGQAGAYGDEFVDRLVILLGVCDFHGMGVVDSRSLRYYIHHFVRRSTIFPFDGF